MPAIAPDQYRSMGLNDYEFTRIVELLGREPTTTELGMFAVMWSEHCGYKYSRPVLALFKKYREALEGKGFENAGVVSIGDGLGVTMKVESHNHPSAVEPYQGAATGVGGIIRDIFTMNARPVALLNSLKFGPIDGDDPIANRNRYLFEHVVAGIAGYGNCVGVPTVGGEVGFHPGYSGNPLVNAMCVGVLEIDKIATAEAKGEGNAVVYFGSATGKDGIHGATFASDALGEDSEEKRPNVQIGDPFAEKLLIEATLEAIATGAIEAIQDMGAAGLTCSTIEMSSKGGVGMEIDLDLVPAREANMSAYELMLSESQERMLAVVKSGREEEVIRVFRNWGVPSAIIGRVRDNGRVQVFRHGNLEADLPARLLTDECPTYQSRPEEPESFRRAGEFRPDRLPSLSCKDALLRLMREPSLASKRWVYQQYDQQVMTQTGMPPGAGDAAVILPRGTHKGIAITLDSNQRQVALHPRRGGALIVAEAARNLAAVGARPVAITDGLNYGNPESGVVYWQFSESVKGIAEAAEILGAPVISGNVSFYNQSDLGEIPPTPMIGMLGLLENGADRLGMGFPAGSHALWLLQVPVVKDPMLGLGASAYLAYALGMEDGWPAEADLEGERRLCEAMADLAEERLALAAHDCSEGGVLFAAAEMAMAGSSGLQLDLPDDPAVLFGEMPGRMLVVVREDFDFYSWASARDLEALSIGQSGGDELSWQGGAVSIADLAAAFEGAIPQRMLEETSSKLL